MLFLLISCLAISDEEYRNKIEMLSSLDSAEFESESLFYFASNGITILCPEASVGDSTEINGVTHRKQDKKGLEELIEAEDWSGIETSCTSDIRDMKDLFLDSSFDGNIDSWDVSSVTNMKKMFYENTSFDNDLNSWDTSSVENMESMFAGATSFNGDISGWDVSNVTTMYGMFRIANAFDSSIGNWDTSSVTNMDLMFAEAETFNQDLSGWCVEQIESEPSSFDLGALVWTEDRPVWGTCP